MTFSLDSLLSSLYSLLPSAGAERKLLIALSGGMDSVVLLHALAELRKQGSLQQRIAAVHVNHGIQEEAASWQGFCENLCASLDIPVRCRSVDLKLAETTGSLENAARIARYQVFEELIEADTVLLQAHHRDDQMETLLLRLMRGAGAQGLSGIPSARKLGAGRLLRPLLEFDRVELLSYARRNELEWVEDASNADQNFDRNYCRHTLLPMIEERWPAYRESWSKTVTLESESLALQQALAEIDLQACLNEDARGLKLDALILLDDPRRRNLLRYWIASKGLADLGWNRLRQLSLEVLSAAEDSACLEGDGFSLMRFQGNLFALKSDSHRQQPEQDLQWNLVAAVEGDSNEISLQENGSLRCSVEAGRGLSVRKTGETLQIRYRRGGESCRLTGRPNKLLKKILHEQQVETWLRSRIPLLFSGEELVCIPGIGIAEAYQAEEGEQGWHIQWEQPSLLL